jgi:hypothetical protein
VANRSQARDRAEAQFDKTQKPKEAGERAVSSYEKGSLVVRERTARLKSLRMAKEAAELDAKAMHNLHPRSTKLS